MSSPTIGRVESENTRQKLDFVSRLSGSIRVKGKKALFIGDSHTSAYGWGWQDMLCEETGMKIKNTAVSGKQTNWMISRLKYYADTTYSYCFIYGGVNDIAAGVGPAKVYSNIFTMVSYCQDLKITPVVITGSDPGVVMSPVSSHWKNYIRNESKLQSLLVDSLKGVYVIDVRNIIEKKDLLGIRNSRKREDLGPYNPHKGKNLRCTGFKKPHKIDFN